VAYILAKQFDVFRYRGKLTRHLPFVMVLQSDYVDRTTMVVAAPLSSQDAVQGSRLTPTFVIAGQRLTLLVPELAAMPRSRLSDFVTNLASERPRIVAALDLLFTGF